MKKIGCGRRSRTFIFEFKARRVAAYTIPQKSRSFGALGFEPRTLRLSGATDRLQGDCLTIPYPLSIELVAVEGIEPTSLDYRSSALPLSYTAKVVDPTGLKPAPYGLKGRRSVTRAPGQQSEFRVWSSEFRVG